MADSVEYYRGYEMVFYFANRPKVRITFKESDGLPAIHGGPLERTIDLARESAKALIDATLASL